jgi:hypothetical protein
MGHDTWIEQQMESPGVPIVHTHLERAGARIELIAFATRREHEGRVDNVLLEIRPKSDEALIASSVVRIRSARKHRLEKAADGKWGVFRDDETKPWMLCLSQPVEGTKSSPIVSVIVAPGTRAPLGSRTTPRKEVVAFWALPFDMERATKSTRAITPKRIVTTCRETRPTRSVYS